MKLERIGKMLKITKKFGVSFLTMLLASLLFIGSTSAAEITPFSDQPDPGGGGTIKGATMSYSSKLTGENFVEMYMDVNTARAFANNVTQSNNEQIAWWASGLLLSRYAPQTVTYVGFVALTDSMKRGNIATAVRTYTDNNKKVLVRLYVSGRGVALYTVKEWVGKVPNKSSDPAIRNYNITYY